jgi:hypothetical protein
VRRAFPPVQTRPLVQLSPARTTPLSVDRRPAACSRPVDEARATLKNCRHCIFGAAAAAPASGQTFATEDTGPLWSRPLRRVSSIPGASPSARRPHARHRATRPPTDREPRRPPVAGVPAVLAEKQGGLLDVALSDCVCSSAGRKRNAGRRGVPQDSGKSVQKTETTSGFMIDKAEYCDSLGFLASLTYKAIGPTRRYNQLSQLVLCDRLVSRALNLGAGALFGKTHGCSHVVLR